MNRAGNICLRLGADRLRAACRIRRLLAVLLGVGLIQARAGVPNFGSATSFGGSDFDSATAIASDANGNCVVAGYFQSATARFGNLTLTNSSAMGYMDAFVAKLSPIGAVLWARSAGGDLSDDAATGVGLDAAGNCYVAGTFYYIASFGGISLTNLNPGKAAFLAKYDSAGNLSWARQSSGGEDAQASALAVTADGHSLVTGSFKGNVTFGGTTLSNAGNYDAFTVKYDASGNVAWANRAGGTGDDHGHGIAVDATGNCYAAGDWNSARISFGDFTLTNEGSVDAFVAKYTSTGAVSWARQAGGMGDALAYAIAADASGDSFVTGGFNAIARFGGLNLTNTGQMDIFVAKFNSAGDVQWARQNGGTGDDQGLTVAVDPLGYSFVAGVFSGKATFGGRQLTSQGTSDTFVTKFDRGGNLLWVKTAGNATNHLHGLAIEADANGNVFLAGDSVGGAFDGLAVTNRGSGDAFVARLDPARLEIHPIGPLLIELTWPLLPAGARLESNGNPALPDAWAPVTTTPLIRGDLRVVELPAVGAGKFFRLKQQ